LEKQGTGIPAQSNSAKDYYYVFETKDGIIGCAGFYLLKDQNIATLAWGMIHSSFHKMGYGSLSLLERKRMIHKINPSFKIALSTSQHTFPFYEKMGFSTTGIIAQGFGPELDRYDMVEP
jgi:N-acetylglutamate synthase-like GNAT family acetyltransferase